MQRFLTSTREHDDFYCVLHAFDANQKAVNYSFQWYLMDELQSDAVEEISNQIFESITFNREFATENEGKWIYCHCEVDDKVYDTDPVCLSGDFIEMINRNLFDVVDFFNKDGNFDGTRRYVGVRPEACS